MEIEVHSTPSGVSNWISFYESPTISDIEGDEIFIELETEVENIKLVSDGESFELLYDQGKLVNPPETLTLLLKNEGSMFPNKYYFNFLTEVLNTDVVEETIAAEQEAPS